jgi:hypothetical protein
LFVLTLLFQLSFVLQHNGAKWRVVSSLAAQRRLRTADWKERVVAVIAQGQLWQVCSNRIVVSNINYIFDAIAFSLKDGVKN